MGRRKAVTEDKEREPFKVEQLRGSQPSSLGGEVQSIDSSKTIKKVSWYEMDLTRRRSRARGF